MAEEDDDLKSIPIIAITAFAMKGDEERIREGGCEAYLSKPISVAKFLATVRAYLNRNDAAQGRLPRRETLSRARGWRRRATQAR